MDDVLQWSAVTLVGLVLWALAMASRRNIARWSARVSSVRSGETASHPDLQTGASVQEETATPTTAPDTAMRLTYRGVPYLRWR